MPSIANLVTAFPDYDVDTLPLIPDDWTDVSYVNDACPCFETSVQNLYVFVDYAKPEDREHPGLPRFGLMFIGGSEVEGSGLSTDDWLEVLACVRGNVSPNFGAEIEVQEKISHSTPIRNIVEGMRYIKFLVATGQMFHLEDDPYDIVSLATGERLWSPETCGAISQRQSELYRLDWSLVGEECPIGYYYLIDPTDHRQEEQSA
jgi:hypothetical protein